MELFKRFTRGLKKPTMEDVRMGRLYKAQYCSLSGKSLLEGPVVCDELGNLYDEETMLRAMLAKTLPRDIATYTFRWEHLLVLQLTPIKRDPEVRVVKASLFETATPAKDALFCCPITGKIMDGQNRFVAFRPSGLVVSRDAVIHSPSQVSLLLGTRKWNGTNIIPLNPSVREGDAMWDRLVEKRGDEMFAYKVWCLAEKHKEEMQREREQEERKSHSKKRARGDEAGAIVRRDDSEEYGADTEEIIEKAAKATASQSIMRKMVMDTAREEDAGPEDVDGQGTGAMNFISRYTTGPTNLDRSVAIDSIQGGGRGDSERFYDLKGLAPKERRARFLLERGG